MVAPGLQDFWPGGGGGGGGGKKKKRYLHLKKKKKPQTVARSRPHHLHPRRHAALYHSCFHGGEIDVSIAMDIMMHRFFV